MAGILIALITGMIGGMIGNISYEEFFKKKTGTNYAVLDIEGAISKTAIKELESARSSEHAKKIIRSSRIKVENWLKNNLEYHCAKPCVVFNKTDIVFGDLIDLNRLYEIELKNGNG